MIPLERRSNGISSGCCVLGETFGYIVSGTRYIPRSILMVKLLADLLGNLKMDHKEHINSGIRIDLRPGKPGVFLGWYKIRSE